MAISENGKRRQYSKLAVEANYIYVCNWLEAVREKDKSKTMLWSEVAVSESVIRKGGKDSYNMVSFALGGKISDA